MKTTYPVLHTIRSRMNQRYTSVANTLAVLITYATLGVWVTSPNAARAHQDPPGCAGNGSGGTIGLLNGQFHHIGEAVDFTVGVNVPIGQCQGSNITARLRFPDGTFIDYATNLTLDPGTGITCPNAADSRCLPGPYRYIVREQDVGKQTVETNLPNVDCRSSSSANAVYGVSTASGIAHTGPGPLESTFADCRNMPIIILHPSIACTKVCNNGIGQNGVITFSGSVSNSGIGTPLAPVSVSNLVNGVLVLVTNITRLDPGQVATFGGSYVPANPCVPTPDTIIVRGTDQLGSNVVSQCSATCSNIVTPCIAVTKNCNPPLLTVGGIVTFSGIVTNCGNVALTNVTLTDTFLGRVIAVIPILPVGGAQAYTTNYVATAADCGRSPVTNTISAVGRDLCNMRNVTNSANCTFSVLCPAPCLLSVKKTACVLTNVSRPCPCVLGYPFASDNPRTSIVFNENEVLAAFSPNFAGPNDTLKVWYSDEHALTLGVRRVIVKSGSATTTTDYPLTPLNTVPGTAINPQVGSTALTGDQAGTDLFERPIYPALFITDITDNPDSRVNDWQYGGTPISPSAVFGTWKGAVRTVDKTVNPPSVTVTPDADPAKNGWNLGSGDPVPAGTADLGFGAEVRWNISDLIAAGIMQMGRVYRVQFMVHDGDQNKVGGDVGENCAIVGLGTDVLCPPPPPVVASCTGGAIAITLQYTGVSINAPTTVTIKGSSTTAVAYSLSSLTNGQILTMAAQNGFTIDATALGGSKLGAQTTVYINSSYEVLHTSCSCSAYPTNNLMVCHPQCLDASSPDNTLGVKGPGSPLWTLVALKDPSLGVITCPALTASNNSPLTTNNAAGCVNVLPPPPTNSACKGSIHALSLGYVGGGCAATVDSQAAGKVTCTNYVNAPSTTPVRIRATDGGGGKVYLDTGTPASIELGDIVSFVGGPKQDDHFAADMVITLYDVSNTLIERVKLKTDCSQPLKLGDLYGGLKVIGMTSHDAGTAALGTMVKYTYEIRNDAVVPLTNVTVIDDLLGTVPGSPIAVLAPGQTITLTTTALVTEPATNTVYVTGFQGITQCSAIGTAAVVRAPSPCPCVLGYPFDSSNPRTSITFSESECLRAFSPQVAGPSDTLKVWYNDEHALTLGVRRVTVKSSSGTTTTDYPLTLLNTVPGSAINPQVGSMALTGDQAGTDLSQRPMYPALFITDVTFDPSSRSNDWQYGGTPIPPHAVFGAWKGAVRVVDKTFNPPLVTVTPDADPTIKNDTLGDGRLGPGGDIPPAGFGGQYPTPAGMKIFNEGYTAEARWNVADLIAAGIMQTGRVYRVQFIVHDGDQNKAGGDAGENCATVGLGATVDCPPPPPPTRVCSSGIVAFLIQYIGANRAAGTTLSFTGSSGASTTYTFPDGLTTGTVLSLPLESDPGRPWTIDATKHGQTKLGTTTSVYFNSLLTEVFHTSCSCRTNNFVPGQPACLDASSPDNPTGTKGEPSPLFLVLDFK